jgi:hypothetical protein
MGIVFCSKKREVTPVQRNKETQMSSSQYEKTVPAATGLLGVGTTFAQAQNGVTSAAAHASSRTWYSAT